MCIISFGWAVCSSAASQDDKSLMLKSTPKAILVRVGTVDRVFIYISMSTWFLFVFFHRPLNPSAFLAAMFLLPVIHFSLSLSLGYHFFSLSHVKMDISVRECACVSMKCCSMTPFSL